ncbi:hypothetical protein LPJ61_006440, partial [Coemansia biformis]
MSADGFPSDAIASISTSKHRHGDKSPSMNFDYLTYSFKSLSRAPSSDNLAGVASKNAEELERRFHMPNEEGLLHLKNTSPIVSKTFHKVL